MCNIKVSDLNSPGKRETERGLFSSPELCVYDEMLVLVRVEGLARVCTPGTVHAGQGECLRTDPPRVQLPGEGLRWPLQGSSLKKIKKTGRKWDKAGASCFHSFSRLPLAAGGHRNKLSPGMGRPVARGRDRGG